MTTPAERVTELVACAKSLGFYTLSERDAADIGAVLGELAQLRRDRDRLAAAGKAFFDMVRHAVPIAITRGFAEEYDALDAALAQSRPAPSGDYATRVERLEAMVSECRQWFSREHAAKGHRDCLLMIQAIDAATATAAQQAKATGEETT